MQTHEIRRRFLDHFREAGHTVVPSASLISQDPTVMFTIAGMAPFKPYFLGQETPPFSRATSVQKCVRTLDIDNVGVTTRHNTFFQMAGNFSFGDYFKEGAITHAWNLITSSVDEGGYGFDPERIWATVYENDDEALELWRSIAGLPESRIQRRDGHDNYWDMGVPGPGGPCSEIYYDRGPEFGIEGGPAADEDRYLEIWNLVFMQDIRGEQSPKDGHPPVGSLPKKNIDTGMGVERVAFLLQGVDNVYETDLCRPIISAAEELSGRIYGRDHTADVRFRVIADHMRSGIMLIGDGVTPSNEGRGYVLRRLLRRAVRSARLLGVTDTVMPQLTAVVRDLMAESYPELARDYVRIEGVAAAEEIAFLKTLASGSKLFDQAAASTKSSGKSVVSGDTAFALHDTHGFPIDLTLEMASESDLSVDTDGFKALMQEQKARARADSRAHKGGFGDLTVYRELLDTHGPTEFTGYTELESEGTVRGLIMGGQRVAAAGEGDIVEVILDRTPLYAESGGQDSDEGMILADGTSTEVIDVQKISRKLWVHKVRVTVGELREGVAVHAKVDPEWRIGARQAHSGTHVVHAALRQVLGPQALQSGSYNKPGYLRLDFAWTDALSQATRSEIEEVANMAVRKDLPVSVNYSTLPDARAKGAIALFGETYDESVRIVEIGGPWSIELCGGTHVEHSSQIGPVSVISESSVGSGHRRIEAFVGIEAMRKLATERALLAQVSELLKVPAPDLPQRIADIVDRLHHAEKELDRLHTQAVLASAGALVAGAQQIGNIAMVAAMLPDGLSAGDVRSLATDIRGRFGARPGVVALFSVDEDGAAVSFAAAATASAIDAGLKAGELVKAFAPAVGGRGGGRPDLAQGGGTNPSGVADAIAAFDAAVKVAVASAQG
ncbi:MAG: alanine--tRNA ligase [Nakamurella sp.]